MSFEGLLNQIGNIEQLIQTQNAYGEKVKSYGVKSTGVNMRIQFNGANEPTWEGGVLIKAPYTIYMSPSYDVVDSDRIISGAITYEIIKAEKDSSQHHWQLQCKVISN